MPYRLIPIFIFLNITIAFSASAQTRESILVDRNGDGIVSALAFGDSITFGIGDSPNGGGFPARLSSLLGIPIENEGLPGEIFTEDGVSRFPNEVGSTTADIIFILEGANDAVHRVEQRAYQNAIQRVVNVANIQGRTVVLSTLPAPTAQHASLAPYTNSYSDAIQSIAISNDLQFADYKTAWETTCLNQTECELYNLPEGLHPNETGYTAMSQVAASAALGIDILSQSGASELESALNLAPGTVIVKPLPAS